MPSTRRTFLSHTLGSSALVASGLSLPGFLRGTASAAAGSSDNRVLVIVQLTGGNDGLNTVIPYRDDHYHAARPTLRVPAGDALRLNDELGFHPAMSGLHDLFDRGRLSVINNVGYPNPDRSHFRSMDMWHACELDDERRSDTGWIGRLADHYERPGAAPFAVHLDNSEVPLAMLGNSAVVPSIRDIGALRLEGDPAVLREQIRAARHAASDDLRFVQRVAVSSCEHATRLKDVFDGTVRTGDYPDFRLASRLRQIAQLIGADFGARVYYTSLEGFDTHARQALSHGPLLRELSESVTAFQGDIEQRGLADHVTVITFSEFGRRVGENGSRGTDHGAAAPMFVIGRHVQAGIHGRAPDLGALIEGDVAHDIDFRRVYATMLTDWLGVDHASALGGKFERMRLLA